MGRVTWRGGRNIETLKIRARQQGDEIKADATKILEESIELGANLTQDFLEDAETSTGRRRAREEGGFPGRHDSGEMVGSVSHEVRGRRAKVVVGVFGWWDANYQSYFRDQDLGEGNIPAARALPQAFLRAEAAFRAGMRDLVRGRR